MKGNRTGRLVATYGMLISLAFIFSYLEAVIPIPIPVPGVKLGLANLVTIVGLYTVGVKGTVAALVTQTAGIFYYLPFLMAAGVVAGGVIGLLGGLVTERIRKFVSKMPG